MHFSIPDTEELADNAGNAYVGYHVHVNGLFHCTVRYKQLHHLHEQLAEEFQNVLPLFPPKKFFPLTINQQEERRLSLERYIQSIGQNIAINGSELLNGFLLNAQQESFGGLSDDECLDVFLTDGREVTVKVSARDSSTRVLREACDLIKLEKRYLPYFALFIVAHENGDTVNILRKLQDFESPLITLKRIHSSRCRVTLGRNYWDTGYELDLWDNATALHLLYIQAVAEIKRQWILVTDEKRDRLNDLESNGKKREYLDAVRGSKYYGYVQFAPCLCDYPQAASKALVAIGRNELSLRTLSDSVDQRECTETTFKVSRMRCWRITTLQSGGADMAAEKNDIGLELSFEYLMARNQLQWITISSEQAILMSVCLQAMIDELLLKNVAGYRCEKGLSGKSWTYVTRDGHSRVAMGSAVTECTIEPSTKSAPIIKKLTDRLITTSVRSNGTNLSKSPIGRYGKGNRHLSRCNVMENNAFHTIGDDDL